jgi:hypothetical protein
MNTRERIIRNLEDRVYGVNFAVALSGTDCDGYHELDELVREGVVENCSKRTTNPPLYRLSLGYKYGIISVVDTKSN